MSKEPGKIRLYLYRSIGEGVNLAFPWPVNDTGPDPGIFKISIEMNVSALLGSYVWVIWNIRHHEFFRAYAPRTLRSLWYLHMLHKVCPIGTQNTMILVEMLKTGYACTSSIRNDFIDPYSYTEIWQLEKYNGWALSEHHNFWCISKCILSLKRIRHLVGNLASYNILNKQLHIMGIVICMLYAIWKKRQ